jgi:hypothetical protein
MKLEPAKHDNDVRLISSTRCAESAMDASELHGVPVGHCRRHVKKIDPKPDCGFKGISQYMRPRKTREELPCQAWSQSAVELVDRGWT